MLYLYRGMLGGEGYGWDMPAGSLMAEEAVTAKVVGVWGAEKLTSTTCHCAIMFLPGKLQTVKIKAYEHELNLELICTTCQKFLRSTGSAKNAVCFHRVLVHAGDCM
jgi:hypothetical protein